jgi:serine/threonine protein phosphatase 1
MNVQNYPQYHIPEGLRVYAIGDIHGHLESLIRMHEEISRDLIHAPPEATHIVYLGDYIDRGPDGRGVIEFLIARKGRGDGLPKTFLKGNHEAALYEFMHDPLNEQWLKYGGLDTLQSYGITFDSPVPLPAEKERAAEKLKNVFPKSHFEFFESLELSIDIGGYRFAHAGVDPFIDFNAQTEKELTRIRQPFLSWHEHPEYKPFPKKLVHGHSVSKMPIDYPHRIGVDTGLYKGGLLTAAVLERDTVRFIQVT